MWPFMIERNQRKQPLWLIPAALLSLPIGLAMGLALPGLFCLFVLSLP
jgi:hypothetical protein